MNAYFAILKGRLIALFQYRSAALAGLGTQVFWGIVKVMIIEAFYAQANAQEPLTLSQAITYIWLGQALLQLLPWNIDKEIELQIRTGNVAYELVRPLDLYGLWFARSLAMRLTPTLMRFIPLFLIAGLFFDLHTPVSWGAGIAFGVSLAFAALLSAAMTTWIIITLFWTISGEGILRLIPHTTLLLSGMLVPLPLFPDFMQPFLNVQPFRGIIDIPVKIYTGVIPASEAPLYFGFQFAWFLFFVFLGKKLLNKALKQFVIQGG